MSDSYDLFRLKVREMQPETVRIRTRPNGMFIFVSGPYTLGNTKANVQKAIEAGMAIIRKGHIPIIPQSMFTGMDDDISYNEIMDCCMDLIKNRCDGVLFLDGWEQSHGARIEYFVAAACWRRLFFGIDDIPNAEDQLRLG